MNLWPELKDEKLNDVVAQIKAAHAEALFRRRHTLRADLVAALQTGGVAAIYSAVGPLVVKVGGDVAIRLSAEWALKQTSDGCARCEWPMHKTQLERRIYLTIHLVNQKIY